MKAHRFRVFIVVMLVVASSSMAAGVQSRRAPARRPDAVEAVRSFYRFHLARDKNFTRANIKLRRWLTPELYTLLLREYHREELESEKHPDEVVFMDGDPFTNTQEHPDSFRIGRAVVRGSQATVPVTFVWSNSSESRAARLELKRLGGAWLIHNIISAGNDDLLKLLRQRLKEAEANQRTG